MRMSGATWTWVVLFAGTATLGVAGDVSLVGSGSIAGNATDQSGLTGLLEDGITPGNLVGGLGSAISYGGVGNLYLATPDRGPADGTTSYVDRAYVVDLGLTNAPGGPDLPDGRHALVVASDNDFVQTNPTRFFVFGIGPTALPDFEGQTIGSNACRVGGSRP